jgi:hypothetical protein
LVSSGRELRRVAVTTSAASLGIAVLALVVWNAQRPHEAVCNQRLTFKAGGPASLVLLATALLSWVVGVALCILHTHGRDTLSRSAKAAWWLLAAAAVVMISLYSLINTCSSGE